MNDKAPPTARRAGLARHLALDHNPLRRRADRLETCIMAGLLAAFLAGAPLIVIAAGSWAHSGDLRQQRAQRSWHQVPAVLLQAAPRQAAFRHWSSPADWVRARWTPPGGHAHIGEVPAPPGSRAGSTVHVWADNSGPVAGLPLTQDVITARVIAAGLLALAGQAIVMLGLARAARWLLDRRRLAAWEAAWTSTGPQWTRRR
jgi:hypothetical protein